VTAYILLFVGGIGVLYFGAEWLVRGAASAATHLGVSPIVLGLTVVALGTSAPELVVSLIATNVENAPDLAVGTILGSNLANLGLILGVSALVAPMTVTARVVTREVPVMLLLTALLLPIMWDGVVSRLDGLFLVGMLVAYLAFVFRAVQDEEEEVIGEFEQYISETAEAQKSVWIDALLLAAGIAGLVLGAGAIVVSAKELAEIFGISGLGVGATIVAVGTSLPELATSVVAAARKEADIAVGNVIGSNVFNLAAVLGITAVVLPVPVHQLVMEVHFPAVMIMSVLLVPLVRNNLRIRRVEGVILLAVYAALSTWMWVSTAGVGG
jgi:cation:H+ antiporter